MSNASKLPANFTLYTDNQLYTVTFSQDDIGKIIQNLNANKAIKLEKSKHCSYPQKR